MKLFLIINLIAVLLTNCLAAVSWGLQKDLNHPGKCVTGDIILAAGEQASIPGRCEQVVCHEESYATFFSCGVIGVPPGYVLGDPIEPDAGYPKCCARKIVAASKAKNS
ncbi:hypothetical protein CVS40_3104 [Lucilia cuprina]|nr:hypothetical protein CVS40_3104 [Lucilia cuprina]